MKLLLRRLINIPFSGYFSFVVLISFAVSASANDSHDNQTTTSKIERPRNVDMSKILDLLGQQHEKEKQRREEVSNATCPDTETADTPSRADYPKLMREFKKKVNSCWFLPPGSANDQSITLRVKICRDGSLFGLPKPVNTGNTKKDNKYSILYASAQEALIRCAPYNIPIEHHALWRTVIITFDPKEAKSDN